MTTATTPAKAPATVPAKPVAKATVKAPAAVKTAPAKAATTPVAKVTTSAAKPIAVKVSARTSHFECAHVKAGREGKIARARCRRDRSAATASKAVAA